MASTLPSELVDEIISYLYPALGETKSALRACTLVSRTWQPLAQAHLFRHIYCSVKALPLEKQFDSALSLDSTTGSTRNKPRTLNAFVAFLQQHPQHGACIRQLQLAQEPPSGSSVEDYRVPVALFVSLLQLIPNICKLYLSGIALRLPDSFPILIHRPSLTCLDLSYPCKTPTVRDVDALLRCFERVNDFTLRYSVITLPSRHESFHLPPPPAIDQITLDFVDFQSEVGNALWQTINLASVRSLRLIPASGGPPVTYTGALETAGPHLHRLVLYVDPFDSILTELVPHVLLCKALKELRLEADFSILDAIFQQEKICEFLSSIQITADRYPDLHSITLAVHIDIFGLDEDGLLAEQTEQVDHRLDEMLLGIIRRSHVAKVDCLWREDFDATGKDIEAYMRRIFPRLLEKNLLQLKRIDAWPA